MTTKADVAQRLAAELNLPRKDALTAVDIVVDCIRGALLRGEKVSLVGFGTFETHTKRARLGRNPRTNERIEIPAKAMTVFRPGRAFREAANAGGTAGIAEAGEDDLSDDEA